MKKYVKPEIKRINLEAETDFAVVPVQPEIPYSQTK